MVQIVPKKTSNINDVLKNDFGKVRLLSVKKSIKNPAEKRDKNINAEKKQIVHKALLSLLPFDTKEHSIPSRNSVEDSMNAKSLLLNKKFKKSTCKSWHS